MKTITIIILLLLSGVTAAQSSGTEFLFGTSMHTYSSTWEPGASVRWVIPRDYRGNLILSFEGNSSYPVIGFEVEFIVGYGFSILAGPLLDVKSFDPHPGGQALLTKKLFRSYNTDFIITAGARKHPGNNGDFGFLSQFLFRFDIDDK